MAVTKWKTLDMVYIAMFAVLITVCSWIAVPTSVPFTMQTFAVFAAVGVLGGRRGTLAVAVYLLMAAIGLPVLAEFTGGLGIMLGSTGGYLLGFLLAALAMWAMEAALGRSKWVLLSSMILGMFIYYAFGTAWFMVVYARQSGPVGLWTALAWCVFPYILPDLLKIALAMSISQRMRGFVKG